MEHEMNQNQWKVVKETKENILLLASAGTGKTETMAHRIINILGKGLAEPQEILCMTFTNKASKEIKERVVNIVGQDGLKIHVSTFHSFCYQLIKQEAKKNSDIFSDFVIYDVEDCLQIIKNTFPSMTHFGAFQKFVDFIKEKRVYYRFFSDNDIEDYKKTIKKAYAEQRDKIFKICTSNFSPIPKMMEYLEKQGHDMIAKYDHELMACHALDFNDLMMHAGRLLFFDEGVQKVWREKYKFIHIDEVQDTSEVEYAIIKQLFGENRILVAGDFFQTIYEWRGSNPKTILDDFKKNYHPQEISFRENYRSTQTLLKASRESLENMYGKPEISNTGEGNQKDSYLTEILQNQEDIITNAKEVGEPIQIHSADGIVDEAEWIYKNIQQMDDEDIGDTCILTRNNNYNKDLAIQFGRIQGVFDHGQSFGNGKQLAFFLIDSFEFFKRQEVKDIIAFLKLAVNKNDSVSMRRILKNLKTGVGKETIEKIESKEFKDSGVLLSDFLECSTFQNGDPYGTLIEELEKGNVIVYDVEATGTDTTEDEIIEIAAIQIGRNGKEISRFHRFLKNKKPVGTSQLVHHFSDEMLAECGEDPKQVIEEFLGYIDGKVLVGHNIPFDISILRSYSERLGTEKKVPFLLPYYDTLDIYRRFYPNLTNHKLEFLGDYFKVSHKSTHDAMDDILATAEILMQAIERDILPSMEKRHALLTKALIERMKNISKILIHYGIQAQKIKPSALIQEILDGFHILERYKESGENARAENLQQLVELAKEIEGEAEQEGTDTGHKVSYWDIMMRLLTYSSLSKSDLDAMSKRKKRIPIITIHQAKGMEFRNVFLAGVAEGIFPNYMTAKSGYLGEEKRLFYVAMTRAKKRLFLSYIQGYYNKKNLHDSRLLQFLNSDYVCRS